MKFRFIPLLVIYLSGIGHVSAQTGMWTWLKGADTSNFGTVMATFGTQGVEAPANNPSGIYEPCQWTDTSGIFWFFGGQDGEYPDYPMGDLWRFNPVTNNWTWMKGTGIAGAAPVFGAEGVPSVTNEPGGRGWGMASWVDHNGDFWMYGGENSDYDLGDMWRYHIATNTWTWMQGTRSYNANPQYGTLGIEAPGNNPGGRECCGTWVDSAGYLWLYGGLAENGSNNYFGDLWRYNIVTNNWAWMGGSSTPNVAGNYGTMGVASASNTPGACSEWCSWTDNLGNFWLYGGQNANSRALNCMWRYQPAAGIWTWMAGTDTGYSSGNYPPFCASGTAYESSSRVEDQARWKDLNGNLWFYSGGFTSQGIINDLWYFNPVSLQWTFVNGSDSATAPLVYGVMGVASPTNSPSGRVGSIPWLSKSGELYLFGGSCNEMGWRNDVWKFTIDTSCGNARACTFTLQSQVIPTTCGQNNGSISIKTVSGIAPFTFLWNNGVSSDSLGHLSPGSYQVTVTDSTGCNENVIAIIDSSLPPSATISAENNPFCPGDSARICTSGSFNSYQWSIGSTDTCIEVTEPGDYYVTVTDANGCSAISNHLDIQVYQSPLVSITVNGDTLHVYYAQGYQWYLNGSPVTGGIDSILIARIPGTYTVAILDSNGCLAYSNGQVITAITNGVESMNLKIYPQPVTDELNINYTLNESTALGINVEDVTGRLLINTFNPQQLPGNHFCQVHTTQLSSGIYLLIIYTDTGTAVRRFVKE